MTKQTIKSVREELDSNKYINHRDKVIIGMWITKGYECGKEEIKNKVKK